MKERQNDQVIIGLLTDVAKDIGKIKGHMEAQGERLDTVEGAAKKNDKSITIIWTVGMVVFALASLGAAVWQAIAG